MIAAAKRLYFFQRQYQVLFWAVFIFLVYLVFLIKITNVVENNESLVFTFYSIAVSAYLFSRFVLAHFYVTVHKVDRNFQPKITFAVPVKNEETVVREVIMRIARSNYPKSKIEIIAINDGSTDKTIYELLAARDQAASLGVDVKVINWVQNRGKRHGMYACAKEATGEVIIFIDSDSLVQPDTTSELVKYLVDPKVGAVTAHCWVENKNENVLTKMQAIKYYVAFKAFKSSESIFGAVTCLSGPCSAYKKEYLDLVLDEWLNQTFLGVECTYGDDRSLTNALLSKGYKTVYAPEAGVSTFVPETLPQYKKQQNRWKKSWFRECLLASKFMWKQNPIMSISFYLMVALTLLAPIVVIRALVVYPIFQGRFPFYYLFGILVMSLIYGLYYTIYSGDRKWIWGMLAIIGYSIGFFWQLPYAILTIKDSSWGTR